MLKFKSFIIESKEGKNVHLEHIEDIVFNEGVTGTRKAIKFLLDLRDMLAGNSRKSVNLTTKWDGCIHEDTIILTNMGEMTVKEIYERPDLWRELKVMGKELNSPLQYDHFVPLIEAFHHENGTKEWVEITLANGEVLKMTEDHEVHTTNRGWVQAKDLTENDDITEL